jgi:hypothetical protein
MIPKINFVYSRVYDNNWQIWKNAYNKKIENESDKFTIKEYFNLINNEWIKNEYLILNEISKILNLKWKNKFIKCYIIREGVAFSDPLTIPVKETVSLFIDILTHELIHIIITQNKEITLKPLRTFKEKFENESEITKVHIIIHAILKHIYLKILGKDRLKRDIERHTKNKHYEKAWIIVEEIGYENIINEIKFI